ncbi:MAG: hypothetical protein VKJ46_04475 [Leptolyngbyaceae bacterium]|nr:hypothetical protein [Leptolyngbyaceae bacterium]
MLWKRSHRFATVTSSNLPEPSDRLRQSRSHRPYLAIQHAPRYPPRSQEKVGGLSTPHPYLLEAIANMALDLQNAIQDFNI